MIFIHSLNNYSGSPKVLAGVIAGFSPDEYRLHVLTSRGEGFLNGLPGVTYHNNAYRWTQRKGLTAFWLILSQVWVFLRVCSWSGRNTVFYINSIIPFSAVLACKITGKKMIVHIHENMNAPKVLYRICKYVIQKCVTESVYVSQYLANVSEVKGIKHIVHNGIILPNDVSARELPETEEKKILMVAALRRNKGVYMMAELALRMPAYTFRLVLSATEDQAELFFREVGSPENLLVFPLQKEMSTFYKDAHLLLQLTQASKVVETYGMTIVEAMSYGVPSIVPNVGGPKEIVQLTGCGKFCNTENADEVQEAIEQFLGHKDSYVSTSERCLQEVKQFSLKKMQEKIATIVHEKFQS